MFEIVFDSIRGDFTPNDFDQAYLRLSAKLQDAAGEHEICFTKNSKIALDDIFASRGFEDLHDLLEALSDAFSDSYQHIQFLIAVPEDSTAARLCLQNNPNAKWGGVLGRNGFIYGNLDDSLILHETLHICGADDCYKFGDDGLCDTICGHPDCVMQYAPRNANLDSETWLCQQNVHNIRDRLRDLPPTQVDAG